MAAIDDGAQIRVPKAADLVARHVRGRIVRGELQEGDSLPPESALMEQYNVSRPTLREAFRILEHEGLIVVRRGARGGARVRVPDPDIAARHAALVLQYRGATLGDVLEAWAMFEPPVVAILANRRDRISLARRLQKVLDEQRPHLGNPDTAPAFHRLLAELAGNQTLLLLTTMLEYISEAAATDPVHEAGEGDVLRAHKAHYKVVELIRSGDAEAAEAYWREHLTGVGAVLARMHGGRATLLDVLG